MTNTIHLLKKVAPIVKQSYSVQALPPITMSKIILTGSFVTVAAVTHELTAKPYEPTLSTLAPAIINIGRAALLGLADIEHRDPNHIITCPYRKLLDGTSMHVDNVNFHCSIEGIPLEADICNAILRQEHEQLSWGSPRDRAHEHMST